MELLLLVGLIGVGALLTRYTILTKARVGWINKWIIYIALPAVALSKIPGVVLSRELLAPIVTPLVGFALAAILFLWLFRAWLTRSQRLVLTLLGGLGNTSFIGFPLVTYFYGVDHLGTAVIYDQLSFLLLATLAQWLIFRNDESYHMSRSLKKIVTFPAFIALILAIWIPPSWIVGAMDILLDGIIWTISPLAMLIVGYQVSRYVDLSLDRLAIVAIFYKLLMSPVVTVGLLYVMRISGAVYETTVLESGMASMITASLFLLEKDIESRLSSQILFWGTLISFITTYLLVHWII